MANADLARIRRKVVQYFYDPLPHNEHVGVPIFCLGVRYENPPSSDPRADAAAALSIPSPPDSSACISKPNESQPDFEEISKSQVEQDESQASSESAALGKNDDGGWPTDFLDDFESRPWFTYRSNFPPIPRSLDPKAAASMTFGVRLSQLVSREGFTSDAGWGCMIRSGQSLLADSVIQSMLGRGWRIGARPLDERRILSLFADDPRAPFSIHNFVNHGASACGKHPGEWFGPSATAQCIQALVNDRKDTDLAVYVTGDGTAVYEDAVFKTAKARTGTFQPTLILICTRLGLDRITPVYWEALKDSLRMPQSVGIAGGRPSSSHYFVGTQGDDLFYLDPHTTRAALPFHKDVESVTDEEVASCHNRRLRKLDIREMDPSMLMGFLVHDEADWKNWRQRISDVPGKAIIHVADKQPPPAGSSQERQSAIDEVETFDTEDDFDEHDL